MKKQVYLTSEQMAEVQNANENDVTDAVVILETYNTSIYINANCYIPERTAWELLENEEFDLGKIEHIEYEPVIKRHIFHSR